MIRTKKVACSVTGERIRFEGEVTTNVMLKGKTLKLKMFVLRNTNNLFGTEWVQKFELWDLPISYFCKKVDNITVEAEKLKKDQKKLFPNVFLDKLGRCTKMEAKFKLQDNVTPVFKKKRNVPFASLQKIDKELDRLVNTGILTTVDYSNVSLASMQKIDEELDRLIDRNFDHS